MAHTYLTEAKCFDLLGYAAFCQVFVYFAELVVVVDESLDVRDEVTHQVLHSWTWPVVLCLGFGGDTLRKLLHSADLQEQLSVSLAESQLLLVQLAFEKYISHPAFIILYFQYENSIIHFQINMCCISGLPFGFGLSLLAVFF